MRFTLGLPLLLSSLGSLVYFSREIAYGRFGRRDMLLLVAAWAVGCVGFCMCVDGRLWD